jgi:hypothetical protein
MSTYKSSVEELEAEQKLEKDASSKRRVTLALINTGLGAASAFLHVIKSKNQLTNEPFSTFFLGATAALFGGAAGFFCTAYFGSIIPEPFINIIPIMICAEAGDYINKLIKQ